MTRRISDTVSVVEAVLCNDPWTNNNFVSGDLTVNGLIGNGSTKYLNTGINESTLAVPQDDVGLTAYTITTGALGAVEIGVYDSTRGSQVCFCYTGNVVLPLLHSDAGSGLSQTLAGYQSHNRLLAASFKIYRANSGTAHELFAAPVVASNGLPARDMYGLCRNNNGTPAYYSARRVSFLGHHGGLTQAESSSFYNAIQALRTALGGGYV
jgi:hypothetical protein